MAKRRFRSRGKFRRIRRRGRGRRLKKFVKRVVRRMSEIKYSFLHQNGGVDSSNATLILLNPTVSQGPGKNNRLGNKIKYRWVTLKIALTSYRIVETTSSETALVMRMVLFTLRNQPAATTGIPSVGEVVDTPSWPSDSSLLNDNIRVIRDYYFPMGVSPNAHFSQLPSTRAWTKRFRMNNNVTFRSDSDTAIRDPHDQLWCMLVTDNFNVSNSNIAYGYEFFTRISYIDI